MQKCQLDVGVQCWIQQCILNTAVSFSVKQCQVGYKIQQCNLGYSSVIWDTAGSFGIQQCHVRYSTAILDTAAPSWRTLCILNTAVHFKYSCANLNTTVKYWIQHCNVGYSRVPNNCHFENISAMVDTKQ